MHRPVACPVVLDAHPAQTIECHRVTIPLCAGNSSQMGLRGTAHPSSAYVGHPYCAPLRLQHCLHPPFWRHFRRFIARENLGADLRMDLPSLVFCVVDRLAFAGSRNHRAASHRLRIDPFDHVATALGTRNPERVLLRRGTDDGTKRTVKGNNLTPSQSTKGWFKPSTPLKFPRPHPHVHQHHA